MCFQIKRERCIILISLLGEECILLFNFLSLNLFFSNLPSKSGFVKGLHFEQWTNTEKEKLFLSRSYFASSAHDLFIPFAYGKERHSLVNPIYIHHHYYQCDRTDPTWSRGVEKRETLIKFKVEQPYASLYIYSHFTFFVITFTRIRSFIILAIFFFWVIHLSYLNCWLYLASVMGLTS